MHCSNPSAFTTCLWATASHHITSHHITSHHITPRHVTSRHITSHHIASHRITSHHITFAFTSHSHHIASHHITSPHQKRSPKRLPNHPQTTPQKSPAESQNGLPILQGAMVRWGAPKWTIPSGTWPELVPHAMVGFGAPKPTIAPRKISRLFQCNSGDLGRTSGGPPADLRRTSEITE